MSDNSGTTPHFELPDEACLPINHCNLPCQLLGSLQFQQHPQSLHIDGVRELHHQLFELLVAEADPVGRAVHFERHMRASFLLDDPEAAGHDVHARNPRRHKTDYRQLLRGWLFNADGREAAIIKGWVESRFGLQARSHGQPFTHRDDPAYRQFQASQSQALYNSNALHSQLDVLYSYCQYELEQQHCDSEHLLLYRGLNHLDQLESIRASDRHHRIVLLNNINSFTSDRERADEFGDVVISTWVPHAKLLFIPNLIPGLLQGEEEHLVIGGLYRITVEGP